MLRSKRLIFLMLSLLLKEKKTIINFSIAFDDKYTKRAANGIEAEFLFQGALYIVGTEAIDFHVHILCWDAE